MELEQLATGLGALGCPKDKCAEMAAQLDKRAKQLMTERGQSYEDSMTYLIKLMQQGWAAKERGL
ncbi:MAG: hypothetical protein ACKVHO_22840 [Verrucomicrobiia bacterium]|jgi:hypothetical protein